MIKQYSGAHAQKRVEREKLPAGGYVAKILDAKVQTYDFGDMLVLSFDIAEGIYKDHFKKDYTANPNEDKKWRGTFRLSIPKDDGSEKDEWSKNGFNGFIYAIEDSNPGYTWDWNEAMLKGKLIGVLFRNKEWEWKGDKGWMTECCAVDAVSTIREGKFKQPKDKPLAKKQENTFASAAANAFSDTDEDGELPFD